MSETIETELSPELQKLADLDLESLANEVFRIGRESPLRINNASVDGTCVYHYDGHRCIVGEALHRLGFSDEYLGRFSSEGIQLLLDEVGHTSESEAGHFVCRAQSAQDRYRPWGEAVDEALNSSGFKPTLEEAPA